MRIAKCGLVILLLLPAGLLVAQQQPQEQQKDALAAAARRARARNKENAKPSVVWDNDNISSTKDVTINVVGTAPPSSEESDHAAAVSETAVKSSPAPKDIDGLKAELKEAQDELHPLQTDLDLLQRKNALDQQTYYQNPDYAKDTAGTANLKDERDQIAAKQQEVNDAQEKVDNLQAELDSAVNEGGSSTNSNDNSKSASSPASKSDTGSSSDASSSTPATSSDAGTTSE